MEMAYYVALFLSFVVGFGVFDKSQDRYLDAKYSFKSANAQAMDPWTYSLLRRRKRFWFIASRASLVLVIWLTAAGITGISAFPWWVR